MVKQAGNGPLNGQEINTIMPRQTWITRASATTPAIALAIALSIVLATSAQAADSTPAPSATSSPGPSASTALEAARKAIAASDFERAIAALTPEGTRNPNDADVQNLLGYSNRKLHRYDVALVHYQRALSLVPNHRGANNYLGLLYVETGKTDKARERLAVLQSVCGLGCEEYRTLKAAIDQNQTGGQTSGQSESQMNSHMSSGGGY